MLASLLEWDRALFELLNCSWHAPWLDVLMPIWRTKTTWIPLYGLILGLLFWKYSWKKLLLVLLMIAITILLVDQLSSELLKKSIMRLRPCNTPDLAEQLRLLVHCGSGYSFTSSHASNHFALAFLFVQTLVPKFPKIRYLLIFSFYFWAATIAYGQVYVGVHYPLDVLAGAVLGSLVAWGIWSLARMFLKKLG